MVPGGVTGGKFQQNFHKPGKVWEIYGFQEAYWEVFFAVPLFCWESLQAVNLPACLGRHCFVKCSTGVLFLE